MTQQAVGLDAHAQTGVCLVIRAGMHIGFHRCPCRCRVALLATLRRDEVACGFDCRKTGLVAIGAIGRHSAMSEGWGQPCCRFVAGVAFIGARADSRMAGGWRCCPHPIVTSATPAGNAGVSERGRQPSRRCMATGALSIASCRNMVGLCRRETITGSGMTTGTTGQPGMVHGDRYPCSPYGMATATSGAGAERWLGVRLGPGQRTTGRMRTVVTGSAIGSSGHAGVRERSRQPRYRGMAA